MAPGYETVMFYVPMYAPLDKILDPGLENKQLTINYKVV